MSGKCKIYWGLWPFSVLYGIGVRVRNLLFDVGWLHEERFPLPVICIGNLTVGGTGKLLTRNTSSGCCRTCSGWPY